MAIPFTSRGPGVAFLLIAVMVGWPGLCRAAEGSDEIDIIVESRAQGQNHARYQEVEGSWSDSQVPPSVSKSGAPGLTPQVRCGTRKLLFLSAEEPDKKPTAAAVRFLPKVNRPVRCFVYATWPISANAAPVYYKVYHARGEEVLPIRQEGRSKEGAGNANRWISLGTFDFVPGEDQYVELRIGLDVKPSDSDFRGQAVADSVRFTSKPIPADRAQLAEVVRPQGGGVWNSSLDEARVIARSAKKKILVDFSLPGSSVSQRLEEKIFSDARVREEISRKYVTVRINMAKSRELAAKLGVFRGGTVVIYTHEGVALGQIHEASDPAEFLARLAKF